MSTPAADRRAIVRRSIECALGLNAAIRDRQTAPLTAAVWRVVEPAIAQRDAQLDAVRALHTRSEERRPLDLSLTPIVHCTHCDHDWPCPTTRALDVRRQPPPEHDDEGDGLAPAKAGTPHCNATWPTTDLGTFTCWRAAVHNQEPDPQHAGESPPGWRYSWLNTDPNAIPHAATED